MVGRGAKGATGGGSWPGLAHTHGEATIACADTYAAYGKEGPTEVASVCLFLGARTQLMHSAGAEEERGVLAVPSIRKWMPG